MLVEILSCFFSHLRVETSCTVNPQQIEVTEFERHGRRPTCSKLRVFQPRCIDRRRCGKQARPSTSFIDNAIDLPWQNLPSSEFGTTSKGSTLITGDVRISL